MSLETVLLLPLCLMIGSLSAFGAGGDTGVRRPAVAGRFYQGDAPALRSQVESYLAAVESDTSQDRVVALMAPHAGYVFSGPVAARSYGLVQGDRYDRVVLIGSAHSASVAGLALDGNARWRTPLGELEVDQELVERLAGLDPAFTIDSGAHRRDHVLEVQLPFLQVALQPGFRIVPILMGPGSGAAHARKRLVELLPPLLKNGRTLLVCSADLTHYPREAESRRIDTRTLQVLEEFDEASLTAHIRSGMAGGVEKLLCVTCSEEAILATMGLARAGGADRARSLYYANSADSQYGDPYKVVGYGAAVFLDVTPGEEDRTVLDQETRRLLLELARSTLEARVKGEKPPLFQPDRPVLTEMRGAFVTLHARGRLRGCIGYIQPVKTLWESVRDNAVSAALKDPRFPPVRPRELEELHIEISVLSPLEVVSGPEAIRIGLHGVQVSRDHRRAVFLPQVAPEQGWDIEQTLNALCRKAGLSAGSWREPGMTFQVFTAEVFQEPPREAP